MTTITYHETEVPFRDGNYTLRVKDGTVYVLEVQRSGAEVIYKYVVIR